MLRAPHRLCCELKTNPLGITSHPHFSWWVDDTRPAEVQSSFEIEAAGDARLLESGDADLWRSGRIDGNANAHVAYEGLPLSSGQRVYWRVRTFDSDALPSPWSEAAWFEMGLLSEADWSGEWITSGWSGSLHGGVPVTALRRTFSLPFEPLRARFYLALCGEGMPVLNGARLCGPRPALWMNYEAAHPYLVFDLTEALKLGENTLGVLLGEGIYSGPVPPLGREIFGAAPKLRGFIDIEGPEGERLAIATDTRWEARPSWILTSDPWRGETTDFRHRDLDWFAPGSPTQAWSAALLTEPPAGLPVAVPIGELANEEVIQATRTPRRRPVSTHRGPTRLCVTHDFERRLHGRLRLKCVSRRADAIVVRYSFDGEHFDSADYFTSAGLGTSEILEADLSTRSFVMAQVEYTVRDTLIEDVTGLHFTHQRPGDLLDSAELVVQSDHTTLNRLVSVCTDSMQALAQLAPLNINAARTALPDFGYAITWAPLYAMNPDGHAYLRKWIRDARGATMDAQDGRAAYDGERDPLPDDQDSVARFDALAELAWSLFRQQDDLEILEEVYPELRANAVALKHLAPDTIRQGGRADLYGEGQLGSLVATARLCGTLERCMQIATVLEMPTDTLLFEQTRALVVRAFKGRFTTVDGRLIDDDISALLAAIHFNLLEGDELDAARTRLTQTIRSAGYVADVVPILTGAILPELERAGRLDLAYMVLLQTTPTSWLGRIMSGERFVAGARGRDIAQVGVLRWILHSLVGLNFDERGRPESNGFKHLTLTPKPPLGTLFQAGAPIQRIQASVPTLNGMVEVSWRIDAERFELELVLPPSTTAEVVLPDGVAQSVHSGKHRFSMAFSRGGDGLPTLLQPAWQPIQRAAR